jgi:hypothetical protein
MIRVARTPHQKFPDKKMPTPIEKAANTAPSAFVLTMREKETKMQGLRISWMFGNLQKEHQPTGEE